MENNETLISSDAFAFTNARGERGGQAGTLPHEFIHSKYKTIHELDPIVCVCVCVRAVRIVVVAEKWRVSYACLCARARTRTIYRRGRHRACITTKSFDMLFRENDVCGDT